MIATNVRRLARYLGLAFGSLWLGLGWWQVLEAPRLAARPDNPEVIASHRSALRGTIFDAGGRVLASSVVQDGISRRTYADPAFAHVIGYASLRYGTTGVEQAWDDLLTGRADPNPLTDLVNDVLDREPQPRDLTLTIDRRLQDFAAAQLGGTVGAVVAIDPATGAILAMVSSPTFDATGFSGDPATAEAAWLALAGQPDHPLLDRTRRGHYTPGSVLKVLTAAAALDAGVITPQTTYPNQPVEERDGFVVSGFTIREHPLGDVTPALWPLSPALQVSSNIFFAHVGLELGEGRFLDYARRFGFCAPLRVGSVGRSLAVDASYVSGSTEEGCAGFIDRVELANAAYGQAQTEVTPMQMALLAATIANGGLLPVPFVVRDVRAHAADPSAGPDQRILEGYGSELRRVIGTQAAADLRAAMVDAVHGELGRPYAGSGSVGLYGIGGVMTAGKTGTAERGGGLAPHAWFIGFAPAEAGANPAIAIAVIIEGGQSGAVRAAPVGGAVMAEWLRLLGTEEG